MRNPPRNILNTIKILRLDEGAGVSMASDPRKPLNACNTYSELVLMVISASTHYLCIMLQCSAAKLGKMHPCSTCPKSYYHGETS